MRGANFLASWASGGPRKETALVVDVGGTTVCHMATKREADIRLKWVYYSPQDSHDKQQPNINSVELGSTSQCPMSILSAWEVDLGSETTPSAR
jgi:hypothetical protein